MASRKKIKNRT